MRVLLVEDDPSISRSAGQYLRDQGFSVDTAENGGDALTHAQGSQYDAVILDLRLPDMDGMDVCRQLRADGAPVRILMATARDGLDDRIAGLDSGADDYLVKPYALSELAARLRAVVRRASEPLPPRLQVSDLTLDTGSRVASRGTRIIDLTNKEFAILEFLMRHQGEVISRERISSHAWGASYDAASNVIDVYVGRLRRKIDADGEDALISTIRGAGYRLGPAEVRPR